MAARRRRKKKGSPGQVGRGQSAEDFGPGEEPAARDVDVEPDPRPAARSRRAPLGPQDVAARVRAVAPAAAVWRWAALRALVAIGARPPTTQTRVMSTCEAARSTKAEMVHRLPGYNWPTLSRSVTMAFRRGGRSYCHPFDAPEPHASAVRTVWKSRGSVGGEDFKESGTAGR